MKKKHIDSLLRWQILKRYKENPLSLTLEDIKFIYKRIRARRLKKLITYLILLVPVGILVSAGILRIPFIYSFLLNDTERWIIGSVIGGFFISSISFLMILILGIPSLETQALQKFHRLLISFEEAEKKYKIKNPSLSFFPSAFREYIISILSSVPIDIFL